MDRDDRLTAYLQGRLDPEARAAFEREVQADPALAAEVAALRDARARFAEEAEAAADRREAGWRRLSAAIAPAAPAAANENRPLRLSLVQAAAVALVAVGLWQVAAVPLLSPDDAAYRTVSEAPDAISLQIVFRADAPLGEVADLLRRLGGTVQDGPGALGVWRVAFADAQARDDAAAALADQSDLVEMVTAP